MKFLFVLALLIAFAYASNLSKARKLFKPLSQDHVDYINSLNTTWIANLNFKNLTVNDLKALCGTILKKDHDLKNIESPADESHTFELPDEFDSRKKWPQCADVIGHVRDQGSCGSCWAVAVATAITDRVCIASNGMNKTQLSAQDITSCCQKCAPNGGCNGGFPEMAWEFWVKNGLVSGGDFGDKDTCMPYLLEPCEHHTAGPRPKCGDIVPTPKCEKKCVNQKIDFEKDKNFGESVIGSTKLNSVRKIKAELFKRGTMSADFSVYDDFLLYKEGVYTKTPNAKYLGGHAISVIGWGQENGVEYWLCKNNWNTDWGMKGLFKIKIGEVGINNEFFGGIPRN